MRRVLIFLFTAPLALAAAPVGRFGARTRSNAVWCEFLLQSQQQIEDAANDIRTALYRTEPIKRAMLVGNLRPMALAAFGVTHLPIAKLNDLQLRFDETSVMNTQYSLKVEVAKTLYLLDRETLTFPPVLVWKSWPISRESFDENVRTDHGNSVNQLAPEGLDHLTVGAILNQSLAHGRKYLAVDRVDDRRFRLTLGLDVPCRELEKFTGSRRQIQIRRDNGWICRVPVLRSRVSLHEHGPPGR
jgi:hypothetical protein